MLNLRMQETYDNFPPNWGQMKTVVSKSMFKHVLFTFKHSFVAMKIMVNVIFFQYHH